MYSVKLLDLHQDVLYEIFEKLERKHLYLQVRHVCKLMKQHIDSYMSLAGKFMLCDESTYNDLTFIRIAYIFKTNSSPFLMDLRETSPIPEPISSYNPKESIDWVYFIGSFGGVIQGKIIVGYYLKERMVKIKSPCLVKRLLGRHPKVSRRFCRLVPYLYEYQESTDSWISIPQYNQEKIEALEYDCTVTCHLSFNIVGDTIVVGLCNYWKQNYSNVWSEFKIVKFQVHFSKRVSNVLLENNHQSGLEYSFYSFKATYVIKGEKSYGTTKLTALDCSINNDRKENMCLHGFTLITGIPNFFFCQLDPKRCTKVRYHPLSQRDPAMKCVSFKLKSNIYIIGLFGNYNFDDLIHRPWRCDRYNIEKDEYQKSCHLISSCVKDIFSAAADFSESYALILTDYGLLTFTEDNGFKYEGFFWTNSTDLRDLDSVPSDSFSFDSSLSLRPYFTLSKSSLFRIG